MKEKYRPGIFIVTYRKNKGVIEYIILKRKMHWSGWEFPKGGLEGIKKRLTAFEMVDKGIPRQHYEICNAEGDVIGEVTSGTMSPMLKKGIGMGYVKIGLNKVDMEVYIKVRTKLLKAKTTSEMNKQTDFLI